MANIKVLGAVGTDLFTSSAFDYYRMNKADICCAEPTAECDYHQFTGSGLNVLFFLPQMDEPIDPTIRAFFLHGMKHHKQSTADEIVCHWLRYLAKQNRSYELLLSSGSFSLKDMRELKLPIQFPLTTALRLHARLVELFDLLSNDDIASKFTHSDLLIHWYPKLGEYYKKQRQPTERQITLANKKVPNETIDDAKIRTARSIVHYHTLYEDQLDVVKKIRTEYEKKKTAKAKQGPTIMIEEDDDNASAAMVNPLHNISSPALTMSKSVYYDQIYGIEEYEVPDNHPINNMSEKEALISPMSPLTPSNKGGNNRTHSGFFAGNKNGHNEDVNIDGMSNNHMKDLTPVSQQQYLSPPNVKSPMSLISHSSAGKSIYFDFIYDDVNQDVPITMNEITSNYLNMRSAHLANNDKQLNNMSMITIDQQQQEEGGHLSTDMIRSSYRQHILNEVGATISSIEDIALQYIMTVDFETYDSFSSPHICRVIGKYSSSSSYSITHDDDNDYYYYMYIVIIS